MSRWDGLACRDGVKETRNRPLLEGLRPTIEAIVLNPDKIKDNQGNLVGLAERTDRCGTSEQSFGQVDKRLRPRGSMTQHDLRRVRVHYHDHNHVKGQCVMEKPSYVPLSDDLIFL